MGLFVRLEERDAHPPLVDAAAFAGAGHVLGHRLHLIRHVAIAMRADRGSTDAQDGPGAGEEETNMAVAPADQEWWTVVASSGLENLAVSKGSLHARGRQDDPISDMGLHDDLPHLMRAAKWPQGGRARYCALSVMRVERDRVVGPVPCQWHRDAEVEARSTATLSVGEVGPSAVVCGQPPHKGGFVTVTASAIAKLYKPRRGRVEFVDVPEMAFVVVPGDGAPESRAFESAIQALYAVSYAAHFLVKKAFGEAPRVMPLEALWWVDDDRQRALVEELMRSGGSMADTDRERWRWQAMIMQPEPIDAEVIAAAIAQAHTKDLASLDRLRFTSWTEGPCAQLLHIGPYADEAPSLRWLHAAIEAAGMHASGRHHEVYLGDPRRSAPDRLRTILRQPVQRT